jgi:signal transduction histidine kinase
MKLTLFRKHLLISISVTLFFIFVGLIASFLATHFERERFEGGPHVMFARLIDDLAIRQHLTPEQAFQAVADSVKADSPMELALLDRSQAAREHSLSAGDLPKAAYEVKMLGTRKFGPPDDLAIAIKSAPEKILLVKFRPFAGGVGRGLIPPPPGGGPHPGPPPPMPPNFGPGPHGPPPPPPPGMAPPGPRNLVINFVAIVLSVGLASALSLFILFYSMREKAALADQIIKRIKSGDLKARFPLTKMDEAGKMMAEFNKMADEIESLVERVRNSERGRMALLQELAHDLRTPVASLKSFTETLISRKNALSEDSRTELLHLSFREIEYFERLIEDLLFLAQVTEPRFASNRTSLQIKTLVEDELDAIETRYANSAKPIFVEFDSDAGNHAIKGDQHLLRRMLRNAFENAFSFARSKVHVSLENQPHGVQIRVCDDGPGLSAEALAAFGEKRASRQVVQARGGRLSVGLGSVILKTVAEAHGGSVQMQNRSQPDGSRAGAELTITLRNEVA